MNTYLVGGAVRDKLLGIDTQDRDWVVVGSDAPTLMAMGFKPVGKDFPVFLHPDTQEEYALARTERKSGHGYHGFVFHTAPDVTLEQDLARRDLTINAMAQTESGDIIDPFGGQQDLQAGVLRHVSPAFKEDPVRVLRLARFAARFGFSVAPETRQLIQEMIISGELTHLVAERVWQELQLALMSDRPSLFFTCLREINALAVLFPEVDRLFGVPQHPKWHPEIDTGVHVMMVLDQAARLSDDLVVRFAALCHDLGKGTTPAEILPSHQGHEQRSVTLTEALCQRLKVSGELRSVALHTALYHTQMHKLFEISAQEVLEVIEALDAFRKPDRFQQYLLASVADFRGRPGYENTEMPEKAVMQSCFESASAVAVQPFIKQGLQGKAISEALRQARTDVIADVLDSHRPKQ
ncbi:MAG: multifunctional CCA addition/repair protein [Methylophaga sp.]|nr:multifunctional CCA addition/repair protein [Methylophaga sp.]